MTEKTIKNDSHNKFGSGPCRVSVSTDPPAWEEYLSGRSDSTVFHDPRWGQVMQSAYGNRPYYLTARRDGRVVGVLMLVAQKSLLFGSHLCSLPYLDAAGILADDEGARESLISEARALMQETGVKWVELRQTKPVDDSLETRTNKVTLQLPLSADSDEIWKDLKPKVRNQVRKASRAELVCVKGKAELLEEFYSIYSRNMRDLGSPPHGRCFFRAITESFGESARLFIIRQGERAVAASLTLADRHAVRVPWAGSDWRVRDLCANMLLYWEMLSDSCDRHSGLFDFGRSTRGAGTYRFKKQWGAEEIPLYWHYLLPEGRQMPELRPDSRKFRFMVACWKKLPVCLAKMIGPRIISKLS